MFTDDLSDFLWKVMKINRPNWRGPCIAIFEGLILKEVMGVKPVLYRDQSF